MNTGHTTVVVAEVADQTIGNDGTVFYSVEMEIPATGQDQAIYRIVKDDCCGTVILRSFIQPYGLIDALVTMYRFACAHRVVEKATGLVDNDIPEAAEC